MGGAGFQLSCQNSFKQVGVAESQDALPSEVQYMGRREPIWDDMPRACGLSILAI